MPITLRVDRERFYKACIMSLVLARPNIVTKNTRLYHILLDLSTRMSKAIAAEQKIDQSVATELLTALQCYEIGDDETFEFTVFKNLVDNLHLLPHTVASPSHAMAEPSTSTMDPNSSSSPLSKLEEG